MSDVNPDVKIEIKGGSADGAKKLFDEVGRAAEDCAAKTAKPGQSLKELAGQSKTLQKSFGALTGSLTHVANQMGIMDGKLGVIVKTMGALKDATGALRGAGGIAGLFGISGAGIGAIALPLAGVAAAIAGVAAAATIASPALQDKFGKALYNASAAAKEQTESLKKLKAAQEAIGFARSHGIATAEENARVAGPNAIRSEFGSKQYSVAERMARANDAAQAGLKFQDNAVSPYRDKFESLHDRDAEGKIDFGKNMETLKGLKADYQVSPELKRQQFVENSATKRAKDRQDAASGKMDEFKRAQDYGKAIGERKSAAEDLEALKSRQKNADSGEWDMSWLGFEKPAGRAEDTTTSGKAALQRNIDAAKKRLEKAQQAEAQAAKNAPNKAIDVSNSAGAALKKEVEAANEDALKQAEKTLEMKHKINQAEIEHLKTIEASVHEQAKLAAETVKTIEANMKGTGRDLALNEDKKDRTLEVVRKMKGGEQLDEEDLAFAQQNPLLKGRANAELDKRADADPAIKEIMEFIKPDLDKAKGDEKELLKLDAKITNDIEVKIGADAAMMAKITAEQIVPAMEKTFADLGRLMALQVTQAMEKHTQDMHNAANKEGKAAG